MPQASVFRSRADLSGPPYLLIFVACIQYSGRNTFDNIISFKILIILWGVTCRFLYGELNQQQWWRQLRTRYS